MLFLAVQVPLWIRGGDLLGTSQDLLGAFQDLLGPSRTTLYAVPKKPAQILPDSRISLSKNQSFSGPLRNHFGTTFQSPVWQSGPQHASFPGNLCSRACFELHPQGHLEIYLCPLLTLHVVSHQVSKVVVKPCKNHKLCKCGSSNRTSKRHRKHDDKKSFQDDLRNRPGSTIRVELSDMAAQNMLFYHGFTTTFRTRFAVQRRRGAPRSASNRAPK